MLAGTLVTAIGFMQNGFAKSTAGAYTMLAFIPLTQSVLGNAGIL
jgi:hypothetical protein